MMGDRSLGKAQEEVLSDEAISGGDLETGALELLVRPARGFAVGLRVAQRGVADTRELVGQRAGGLVVVGARLHAEGPLAKRVDALSGSDSAGRSFTSMPSAFSQRPQWCAEPQASMTTRPTARLANQRSI